MIRKTVVCLLTVLALGVSCVHGTSSIIATGGSPSIAAGSPSIAAGSSSKGVSPGSSNVAPSGVTASNGVSSIVDPPGSSSIAPSPGVLASSGTPSAMKSSFTPPSAIVSRTATPLLSSASSKIIVHSSTPVHTSSIFPASFFTPAPTAVLVPESIELKDKSNNETCLIVKFEVDFSITYNANVSVNGTLGNETKQVNTNIPLNGLNKTDLVTGESGCSYANRSASFLLAWNEVGNRTIPPHTFGMKFELNSTTHKWNVAQVTAVFQTNDSYSFKDAVKSSITARSTGKIFGSRPNDTDYICNAGVTLSMSDDVTAKFKDVKFQLFNNEKSKHSDHCSADEESDDDDDNTVPIAVGAALGGLVLIVLVAYIVGRRRSKSGYEQV